MVVGVATRVKYCGWRGHFSLSSVVAIGIGHQGPEVGVHAVHFHELYPVSANGAQK